VRHPKADKAENRLASFWGSLRRWREGTPPPKNVAICLQQLGIMLSNGLDLGRALDTLAEQLDHPRLEQAILTIRDKVCKFGFSLSAAMSQYPDIFPPSVQIMMRAGEQGGDIAGRLTRAGQLLENQAKLKAQVSSALKSPLFTMGFSFLVVILIVKNVMPKFADMYDAMHVPLPLISVFVIGLVRVISHWSFTVAAVMVLATIYCYRDALSERAFNMAVETPKLKYWIGTILCTELCDIMGSLIASGIPLHTAMNVIAGCTSQPTHRKHLKRATQILQAEGDVVEAIQTIPYFPEVFHSVFAVGVETGNLEAMLNSTRRLMQNQTDSVIEQVMSMIEPLAISLTGLMMGTLFVGLFLPLYGLLNQLGG
jgi:type IV pilus assembly protein PilC